MSISEKIISKEELEILLWVNVLADYEDDVYSIEDVNEKLTNFIDNNADTESFPYTKEVCEKALEKFCGLNILTFNTVDGYELTEQGKDLMEKLSKLECLSKEVKANILKGKEKMINVMKVGYKEIKEILSGIHIELHFHLF